MIVTGLDVLVSIFVPTATEKELAFMGSNLVKLEYSRCDETEADHKPSKIMEKRMREAMRYY